MDEDNRENWIYVGFSTGSMWSPRFNSWVTVWDSRDKQESINSVVSRRSSRTGICSEFGEDPTIAKLWLEYADSGSNVDN